MNQRAFSLTELSIVLVILGLLTGGILAGKSLIRASELRAVATEYGRYSTAISAFKDKYFALPGDMTNATAFWGPATTCPGDYTTPSTDMKTCNGNGSGTINENSAYWEHFRFWQHLANAGLIEGQYSGVPITSGGLSMTPGVNIPPSALSGSAWSIRYFGTISGGGDLFDGQYNNVYQLGAMGGAGIENASRNLLPNELWNIDTKLDDGWPGQGKIVMRGGMANSCTDTNNPQTAVYLLGNTNIRCTFIARNIQ